jgi:tetratricopeptide (TPR) repeat protein
MKRLGASGGPFPPDSIVESLSRHFFLGRSSAYLAGRHSVFNAAKYRAAVKKFPAKLKPGMRAARGRLLRFLGESERARAAADLDAAIAADPGLAAAFAWRWELRSLTGPAPNDDIERAVALEPKNGWWRLWLALARMDEGDREAATLDAKAAAALLPREALPLAVSGLFLYMLQRSAEASVPLDAALRLDPGMEWAWRLRGMCRFETGDHAGCLADSIEAMRLDENSGLLFVMFGLHKEKTDTRRSIEISSRHIEKHPKDFWAYVFRADNRRSPEIGENLGAIEDLRRAAELDPGRGWVWAYLSRCQVTLGDFRAAGESMARAVALDPECGWIQAWRGEYLRRGGDAPGAAKTLDLALRLFPDYELAYAWRGSARRILGNPRAAIADLNIAIALEPHTLDLCYFERMQAYRALGRVGEALEDIQRASALNPKYVWETDPKRFGQGLAELDAEIKRRPSNALAHLWRGDLMMRMRDFARADADLSLAILREGCPPEAWVLRGRTRCELGQWKEAFSDLDKAIKAAPESPSGWAWRGRARMLQGKHKPAIADFEAALTKEKHAAAWLLSWKGEAEFTLGLFERAEETLTKAVEVHVRFADAYLWRGAARLRLGKLDAGREDLNKTLALRPGDALALKELKALAPDGDTSRLADARTLQREGRHEEAADAYTAMLASGADAVTLRLRAEAYRCMGRYDLSLADQDAVVKLMPRSADALTGRIETKRHLSDFKGGLRDAEAALKLDSKSASAWVLRAECQRSLGLYDEAIQSAASAIACDPAWSWALIVRAKARRQKGDLEGALADTLAAEKSGADSYARGWRAEILRKAGRLKEGLREIAAAVAMQPTNAWFLALRGQIQVDLGAREKGLADLAEAMRLDPRCSCDYDFIGAQGPLVLRDKKLDWVYAWRGGVRRAAGDLAGARADLDHAAALAPGCFWILAWRGELLMHMGEGAAGLALIRRALKLHPRYAQAWIWAGQALLKEEKTADARKAFKAALAIEPDNVWGLIGHAVCLEKAGKATEAAELFARAQAIAPALFSGA